MNTNVYYIRKNGTVIGPFRNWEVLQLYESQNISDSDKIARSDAPNWEEAVSIKDSTLAKEFPALRHQLRTPDGLLLHELLTEMRALRSETDKVKWAARGTAVLIAIIVVFGFTISFK